MKNFLFLLLFFLPLSFFAQIPMIQNFDPGANWTFSGGTGIANYGGSDNYASTIMGTTPYPNGVNISMTSPLMNLNTGCAAGFPVTVAIIFPLLGNIENGADFLRVQYRISSSGSWFNPVGGTFTGPQNTVHTLTNIPNSAVQFRFLLTTDATNNTYLVGGIPTPYNYNISSFVISCLAALPVELTSFTGQQNEVQNENMLEWNVESEVAADHYLIDKRTDSGEWEELTTVKCRGLSTYNATDANPQENINYYRLTQVDIDGMKHMYDNAIVSIDNRLKSRKIAKIVNLLGQPCKMEEPGVIIIYYNDGSIEKKLN